MYIITSPIKRCNFQCFHALVMWWLLVGDVFNSCFEEKQPKCSFVCSGTRFGFFFLGLPPTVEWAPNYLKPDFILNIFKFFSIKFNRSRNDNVFPSVVIIVKWQISQRNHIYKGEYHLPGFYKNSKGKSVIREARHNTS